MNRANDVNHGVLQGRKVCVTGRLISMTHGEFAELVAAHGGDFLCAPRRCGFILVIGDDGWPAQDDGSPTQVFDRARRLRAYGYAVEFQSEEAFLGSLGLTESAHAIRSRHTVGDLTRLLDVRATSVRRWQRMGLIQPVDSTCRLAYFDFHQVSNAKRICELVAAGASLASIRSGMEQIQRWLPDNKLSVVQLNQLQHKTAVFRRNGELMDGSGQRHFDFEEAGSADSAIAQANLWERDETSELFDQAIDLEDAGILDEAAVVYRRAIAIEPTDPILHFNLGNVLYGLGRWDGAAASFQQALRFDADYVEAWNNLGNALSALHRMDDAVDALQQAIRLVPTYADAHHNLADILARLGKVRESARHRDAYKKYCSADALLSRRSEFLRVVSEDTVAR